MSRLAELSISPNGIFGFDKLSGRILCFEDRNEFIEYDSSTFETASYEVSNKSISITIELNNSCNLNCLYCYQTDKNTRNELSNDIIASITDYLKNVYSIYPFNTLYLRFIGGEPLLSTAQLFNSYHAIDSFCKEYNIYLDTHIDSNGTIDLKMVCSEIYNLDICICLSLEKDHNKYRGSFDRIISNINSLDSSLQEKISLRYNVSEENIGQFDDFLSFARKALPNINNISTARIDDTIAPYGYKNLLTEENFAKWNSTTAIESLINHSYPVSASFKNTSNIQCQGYSPFSCKVYSDGIVTVCDAMLHEQSALSIHTLKESPLLLHEYFSEIKNYSITEDVNCSKCEKGYNAVAKNFAGTTVNMRQITTIFF